MKHHPKPNPVFLAFHTHQSGKVIFSVEFGGSDTWGCNEILHEDELRESLRRCLESGDYEFQELARPACQYVHLLGLFRSRQKWSEDVFTG